MTVGVIDIIFVLDGPILFVYEFVGASVKYEIVGDDDTVIYGVVGELLVIFEASKVQHEQLPPTSMLKTTSCEPKSQTLSDTAPSKLLPSNLSSTTRKERNYFNIFVSIRMINITTK